MGQVRKEEEEENRKQALNLSLFPSVAAALKLFEQSRDGATEHSGKHERELKDEKTAAAQQMLFAARTEICSSSTCRSCLCSAPTWLSIMQGTKIPIV